MALPSGSVAPALHSILALLWLIHVQSLFPILLLLSLTGCASISTREPIVSYDKAGRLVERIIRNPDGSLREILKRRYDETGALTDESVRSFQPDGTWTEKDFHYMQESPYVIEHQKTFDSQGRLVTKKNLRSPDELTYRVTPQ